MNGISIFEAIRRAPPPPCDACPFQVFCSLERKACKAFEEYADRGKWRSLPGPPTYGYYMRVFHE